MKITSILLNRLDVVGNKEVYFLIQSSVQAELVLLCQISEVYDVNGAYGSICLMGLLSAVFLSLMRSEDAADPI